MAEKIRKFIKVDRELYVRIKASLRGIQIQQHNDPSITWRTQIDDILEKMNELGGKRDENNTQR